MGDFDLAYIEDSSNAGTSQGTVITAGAANTKGSYTELIASTASNALMLRVSVQATSTNTTEALIDIATGAAASEVDVISNAKYYFDTGTAAVISYDYDYYIPITSGTRISVRMQAAVASDTVKVTVSLWSGTFTYDDTQLVTYGADTANSRGSIIPDPGATENTLGAWTEITASSTQDLTELLMCTGLNGNLVQDNIMWIYQIGTGAAASEVVVVGGITVEASVAELLTPSIRKLPVVIPSGTRISVRCQNSDNDATDRLLDLSFIGINASATAAGGGGGIAHIVGQGGIVG